jgi:hypothetical protein
MQAPSDIKISLALKLLIDKDTTGIMCNSEVLMIPRQISGISFHCTHCNVKLNVVFVIIRSNTYVLLYKSIY